MHVVSGSLILSLPLQHTPLHQAHIELPEISEAMRAGRLTPDGKILTKEGQVFVTKVRGVKEEGLAKLVYGRLLG